MMKQSEQSLSYELDRKLREISNQFESLVVIREVYISRFLKEINVQCEIYESKILEN